MNHQMVNKTPYDGSIPRRDLEAEVLFRTAELASRFASTKGSHFHGNTRGTPAFLFLLVVLGVGEQPAVNHHAVEIEQKRGFGSRSVCQQSGSEGECPRQARGQQYGINSPLVNRRRITILLAPT